MLPLIPDEDKNFNGSLVLDFRKWWRHVKTIYIFGRKSVDMLPRSSSESLKETGWENDIQTIVTTGPNPKIIELRGITISNEIRGSRKLYDDKVV